MNIFRLLLSLSLLLPYPLAAATDLVIVANPRSGITKLTQDQVVNIFLGRYRRLDSGLTAEPLDLDGNAEKKALFYRSLVGKELAEINAYWARLVFSGKTSPPRPVSSTEEALQRVAMTPGALAYMERDKVDGRVVVVFEVGK